MTNTPAGWFPDPESPGKMRYWDGSAWTEHRHDNATSGAAPNSGAADDRPWFKKKRFVIPLAVVALLIVAGIAGGGETETSSRDGAATSTADSSAADSADVDEAPAEEAEPAAPQQATVSANAADMIQEFEDNELQADAKYKGQWVQVSGVVNKIDTEMFNSKKYVLKIGTGSEWDFLSVDCHDMSQAELSSLATGNAVRVVGEFSDGGDLGVELNHCRLD